MILNFMNEMAPFETDLKISGQTMFWPETYVTDFLQKVEPQVPCSCDIGRLQVFTTGLSLSVRKMGDKHCTVYVVFNGILK